MDVFETMQSCATNASECCCNPDLVTYSSIVSACQKSLQWEKALDVYEVRAFKSWQSGKPGKVKKQGHMQLKGMQTGSNSTFRGLHVHICSDLAETAFFGFRSMTCSVFTI